MTAQLSSLTFTRVYFDDHNEAIFVYHMMRAARERFQSGLSALSTRQLTEVTCKAEDMLELENLVLASPEALGVVIMPKHVGTALDELAADHPDPETFVADLERNGLTVDSLALCVHRELVFDAVLQRVGARHSPVDGIDEQLYYEQHREDFTTAEQRSARHLLIGVPSDGPEHRRVALERINWLEGQMNGPPEQGAEGFAGLALQYSLCATADKGGWLGELARGQLDPRLDDLLFRLPQGGVGGPVETELGFHLIFCERIQPAWTQPFSEVRESIQELLTERRRCDCQTSWIAKLRQPGH